MARAHYDIYRDQLATTHASFGYALWEPGPEAGPVRIGDVGYVSEGQFHRLFNALPPLGDVPHEGIPLPEYFEPLILNLPNHISTGVLSPNNCCSAGVNVSPEKPEHLATEPPDYPQFSFLCTTRDGGAVLSLPVNTRYQYTRARRDFGKWMLKYIDSCSSFARRLGLGIDMEDITLVTGCHHTRTRANVVFLENQTRAQASFGINMKATQARGREANDYSINLKWDFPLGGAQGAVCSKGPEGNLNDLQEDQCVFIRGFRVVRRLGIFPKQLKGAAGPNPSLDEDQDNEPDKELGSIPAITKVKHSFCHSSLSEPSKTRDPLHVLLDHIVGRSPDCDMVLVHDDDLARIARLCDSDETLQPKALMDYLQQAQPEIYRCSCLSTSEDGPRNDTGSTTVTMFLEEFHEWGERHDHNRPSLSDGGTESRSEDDCRMSMSPSSPYLGRNVSPGPDLEQHRIGSTCPDPVLVPNRGASPQIGHRSARRHTCRVCGQPTNRQQELDRHYRSYHLPCWIFCPHGGCKWRGDRMDKFTKHWYTHQNAYEPAEAQYRIYDVKVVLNRIKEPQDSDVISSAQNFAVEFVKERALELGRQEWLEDPWGRSGRHARRGRAEPRK